VAHAAPDWPKAADSNAVAAKTDPLGNGRSVAHSDAMATFGVVMVVIVAGSLALMAVLYGILRLLGALVLGILKLVELIVVGIFRAIAYGAHAAAGAVLVRLHLRHRPV
jgi:hypothetical protein